MAKILKFPQLPKYEDDKVIVLEIEYVWNMEKFKLWCEISGRGSDDE